MYINELVGDLESDQLYIHTYLLRFHGFVQGKRLVFVTNNSTKSRKQYGKKFETLGLSVSEVRSCFYGRSLEFFNYYGSQC
jgi:hypothetical protein